VDGVNDARAAAGTAVAVVEAGRRRSSARSRRTRTPADGPERAAADALHLAVDLALGGDMTEGAAWLHRTRRLLADLSDSRWHGYLAYLTDLEAPLGGLLSGLVTEPGGVAAVDELHTAARRIERLGRRHDDATLVTLGNASQGRLLVRAGDADEGLTLLDDAMLTADAGPLAPPWAASFGCHLLAAAHELVDPRRAAAWTRTVAGWAEALPDAVLLHATLALHRARVERTTGAWDRAEASAATAARDLASVCPARAAEAHELIGDLRRSRGDLDGAERAYARSHRLGRDPQPGLALLRLEQGRAHTAAASIRTALLARGAGTGLDRARLDAAQVRIALAAGALQDAENACARLAEVADRAAGAGLVAMARHARGAVLLGRDAPAAGLPVLRDACRRWHDLGAPLEVAQVRGLLGDAYQRLGDLDGAARERALAVGEFERLGAARDARRVAAREARRIPDGLTVRQVEVLGCLAAGHSNREVAAELTISEKTVARHLSNIFTRLGVSSRTEAAVYAVEQGLAPEHG
jgi:DNA-binding CsgD family transcriptional regulator